MCICIYIYMCIKLYIIWTCNMCCCWVFFAMEISNMGKRRQCFNAISTAIPIPSSSLDIFK